MRMSLPKCVTKYFWGDDLTELKWTAHKKYIIQTILDIGDEKSIKWLLKKVNFDEIYDILPNLKLSDKSRNFWQIYLEDKVNLKK